MEHPRNDYVNLDGANNALVVAALRQQFNGAAWENQAGNQELTLLPSAVRSATIATPDQVNYNWRGVLVWLNITAASGTGGLTLRVQGKDPASGSYFSLHAAPAAVIATGMQVYALYPGVTGGAVSQPTQIVLPRTWRVQVTHGDASSYSYSVGASLVV